MIYYIDPIIMLLHPHILNISSLTLWPRALSVSLGTVRLKR